MEEKDLEILHELRAENPELDNLWKEHIELEKRLDDLGQRLYLSAEEQIEVKRLKKVKLAGRDRMETILAESREATSED